MFLKTDKRIKSVSFEENLFFFLYFCHTASLYIEVLLIKVNVWLQDVTCFFIGDITNVERCL